MNKIIRKINMRNIQDLYDIKSITQDGKINLKDKYVVIYKIDPANLIACDEETKHKIYQAYTSCIRSLPDTIQIMVSREKTDFKDQIQEYKKRAKEIENEKLKFAIQKYVDYLEGISNVNKLYKTKHYLMVENIKNNEIENIINIFSNLKEFGVRITVIKSEEEVKAILRRYIVKE